MAANATLVDTVQQMSGDQGPRGIRSTDPLAEWWKEVELQLTQSLTLRRKEVGSRDVG